MNTNTNFLSGLFVAIGLCFGGFFISKTMYNAKVALNTAEAKGLAERRVKADRANWDIGFSVHGKSKDEIAELYEKAEADQKAILDLLKENGMSGDEINVGVISYHNKKFRDENQKVVDETHSLMGSISVETQKVDLVNNVRNQVNKLIAKGIEIENGAASYYFTKLNEIKPAMLKEATKNARIAANEFASNAGVSVGGIRNARQGSFYVQDVGSNYGDSRKIEKDVRVVTTITFYLIDK